MNSKMNLLKILYGKDYVSGQEIARKLNVSRNMVWKIINSLLEEGFQILSSSKGYKLVSFPNDLTKEELSFYAKTDFDIVFFDTIDSTNTYAKTHVDSFTKNTIIIAKEQTLGKGRFDRRFFSKAGGIYVTFIFKETFDLTDSSHLTLFAAVAICKAIEKVCKIKPDIKWINDIFIKGKKVCGILSEASISCEEKKLKNVIIGIGLNVDNPLDPSIVNIATTLSKETDKPVNKSILTSEIIKNMQKLPYAVQDRKYFSEYKKRLFILKKKVLIDGEEGFVLKLNNDCSLLVEVNGIKKKIYVGDVSLTV